MPNLIDRICVPIGIFALAYGGAVAWAYWY